MNGSHTRSTATPEELTTLRESILLPYLLTMLERNKNELEHSSMLLRNLYLSATEILMDKINKDLQDCKRKLRASQIKVHDEEQRDMIYYYPFSCRGYQDTFGITRDLMRTEISIRLTKYVNELMQGIRAK